jgi:hypothetical protein
LVEVPIQQYQNFPPEEVTGYYEKYPFDAVGDYDAMYKVPCDTFVITEGNGPITKWISSWSDQKIGPLPRITPEQKAYELMFRVDGYTRIRINTANISQNLKQTLSSSTEKNPTTIIIGNLEKPQEKSGPICFSWIDIIE